jgi:hypothetical protein
MNLHCYKIFKVWPWERDLLIRTSLVSLPEVVRSLSFSPSVPTKKRAIRCRLPSDLKGILIDASKRLAKPMAEILVQAARIYREANPVQPDWRPPSDEELFEHEDQKLIQMVVYLDKSDRELIQNLGRGVPGVLRRRDAFLALIPIVEQLIRETGREEDPKRVSVRLKIPADLDEAISKHAATGEPYLHVLLEACRRAEAARQE